MVKNFEFNIGDAVWIMHNNIAITGKIKRMWYTEFISPVNCEDIVKAETYTVDVTGTIVSGLDRNQIFKTKEELKKSL